MLNKYDADLIIWCVTFFNIKTEPYTTIHNPPEAVCAVFITHNEVNLPPSDRMHGLVLGRLQLTVRDALTSSGAFQKSMKAFAFRSLALYF